MPTFAVTPFDRAAETLLVEADEHALEGLHHVFRRAATVMGRSRLVVVRRLPAALVASVELAPGSPPVARPDPPA